MKTLAPAKINWTLEVLGRREDGYHEVRSVMQTIDLCDEVVVEEGNSKSEVENRGSVVSTGSGILAVEGEHDASEDDLTLRAVRALEQATGRKLPVTISLVKRIPVAAGLGGGSSDAAAVLRLVNKLYDLGLSQIDIASVGATLGSDVPFFAYGGSALVKGRGEQVDRLPDVPEKWLVVVVAKAPASEKTATMYAALEERDFSNGSHTDRMSTALRDGDGLSDELLLNCFERPAREVFPALHRSWRAMEKAGGKVVHLCGAGPAIYWTGGRDKARDIGSRIVMDGARVFVARTLTAVEATAVTD